MPCNHKDGPFSVLGHGLPSCRWGLPFLSSRHRRIVCQCFPPAAFTLKFRGGGISLLFDEDVCQARNEQENADAWRTGEDRNDAFPYIQVRDPDSLIGICDGSDVLPVRNT